MSSCYECYDHKGNKFSSKSKMCEYYNIDTRKYYRMISKGIPLKDILENTYYESFIGKKYNMLTIINVRNFKTSSKRFDCICECGNIVENISIGDLERGHKKSCGCGRRNNLLNKRFGRWLVIDRAESRYNKKGKPQVYWKCKCDCGTIKDVKAASLTNNLSMSCGCLQKEKVSNITRLDIQGMKFGKLTAIESINKRLNSSGSLGWKCLCDCGNIHYTTSAQLRSGRIKSCGCSLKNRESKLYLSLEEKGFNTIYSRIKKDAERRNISFELSEEQVKEITSKPCYYCGIEHGNRVTFHYRSKNNNDEYYYYNGIDRIDSTIKKYSIDNVVPCCGACNTAKLEMTQDEFYDWIRRVSNHLKLA